MTHGLINKLLKINYSNKFSKKGIKIKEICENFNL